MAPVAAYKLKNGDLVVPERVEHESGIIGDILIKISKSHPHYESWLRFVQEAPARIEEKYANREAHQG
jgi:hypothetical protein